MKILHLPTLALAVVTVLLCSPARLAQAGGQDFSKTVLEPTPVDLGTGKFETFPFHVSVSVRGGYDDNVNLTSVDEQGSPFASVQLGLAYNFGSPRTAMRLTAGAGFTYYFDDVNNGSDGDNFDVNGFIAFAITHRATPRLTLAADMYATYQSRPGIDTFDFRNISFGRQSQNYFFTVNKFSLGYAWSPKFSTVTSYTFGYTDYDDETLSFFEDRFEHTFGNEFRFLVAPTTTLIAEYRFGIVDYVDNDSRDSTSHFLLAGIDHSFSPRFNLSARAGAEFRTYDQSSPFGADDEPVSPYVEFTLNYAVAQNTALSWTNRYGITESNIPELRNSVSYRTALSLRHAFTPRIAAGLNVAYQHDDYDPDNITPGFTEDSFDVNVWARYSINRNWAFDLGYNHTEVVSEEALFREYTRNRVYGGVTFTF
jgi:hypothetical protein